MLLKNTSPYLLVETEALVYTVESLVAEFGGTLGLFLGFSFMNFWDLVELAVEVFPALAKFSTRYFATKIHTGTQTLQNRDN